MHINTIVELLSYLLCWFIFIIIVIFLFFFTFICKIIIVIIIIKVTRKRRREANLSQKCNGLTLDFYCNSTAISLLLYIKALSFHRHSIPANKDQQPPFSAYLCICWCSVGSASLPFLRDRWWWWWGHCTSHLLLCPFTGGHVALSPYAVLLLWCVLWMTSTTCLIFHMQIDSPQ